MSLPERRHHRLKNYDYSSNGAYFITVCSYQKLHIFGQIENGVMKYSRCGELACKEIMKTNKLRKEKGIEITNWVVMPNHVHLLIEISHDSLFDTNPQFEGFSNPVRQSVTSVVRSYKAAVTNAIRQELYETEGGHGAPCPYAVWQKSFYDNIIRNDKMYEKVWQYINCNPVLWQEDRYNEE